MEKYSILKMVLSMGVGRSTWIDQVSHRLSGAYREWCKQKLSEHIDYHGHDWTREVGDLTQVIKPYLNGEKKKKSNFNTLLAFNEAVSDMGGCFLKARHLLEEHPLTHDQKMKLDHTWVEIDEDKIFQEMLKKFLRKELTAIGYKFT